MRRIRPLIEALLPSSLLIWLLRKRGARIGTGCRIGAFTVLDATEVVLGNHVQIARFNLIHRLRKLEMGSGSRMNGFNWITGAGVGSVSLGRNTAITRLHFLESSGDIVIGENTIIAGRNSHFFTHGISPSNLDDIRKIEIGDWCYIGSSSCFVPGSAVSNYTFVGMGSVVTKPFNNEYVLIAGNPAIVRRTYSTNEPYFAREHLPHDHHPDGYTGK